MNNIDFALIRLRTVVLIFDIGIFHTYFTKPIAHSRQSVIWVNKCEWVMWVTGQYRKTLDP